MSKELKVQALLAEWALLKEEFVDVDAAWEDVVATDEYQSGTFGTSLEEDEWDRVDGELTRISNKLYDLGCPTYGLRFEDYL